MVEAGEGATTPLDADLVSNSTCGPAYFNILWMTRSGAGSG